MYLHGSASVTDAKKMADTLLSHRKGKALLEDSKQALKVPDKANGIPQAAEVLLSQGDYL